MGMISDLPDHMLLEILSWLPTREVVATMLLSRQWKFLWKQVAKLDYDFSQNDGKTFRTLSTVSRKVRDLEIDLTAARNPMITTLPKSLYTCGTLTCLKVKALVLDDIPEEYPICLASLRYLYLSVSSQVSAHMFIGKLTAGAPLLKKSVVRGDNVYNKQFLDYMARKNSLKSFTLCSSESCNLRRCFLWAEPITTSFPKCLSSTLETLEWRDYMDTQFDKDVISFLLKNSTSFESAPTSQTCLEVQLRVSVSSLKR
ncbi:unnamed protein product [Brassica rapa subsp. trilocularis]